MKFASVLLGNLASLFVIALGVAISWQGVRYWHGMYTPMV